MTIRYCLVLCLALFLFPASSVYSQYTPEHPEVKEMVERGVAFLEGGPTQTRSSQWGPGSASLVGLAVYKVRNDSEHPLVQRGLAAAKSIADNVNNDAFVRSDEKIVYYASVAAILLASVDVDRYRSECTILRDFLLRVQRPYGAFGYLEGSNRERGDTSQTQYGMLALWTLDQLGVPVKTEAVEQLATWLQSTQDPSGGFGYQGIMGRGQLVTQDGVTTSLTMAGLCSVLIAGDFLGFYRNRLADAEDEDVPRSLVRVFDEGEKGFRRRASMTREQVDPTVERGVAWMSKNPFTRASASGWNYYARYSEERMESFLEIARGRTVKSPPWYNRGVEDLKKFQDESGGWGLKQDSDATPPQVCTSFAILYLIRSTQKAIGNIHEGVMPGGRELPDDPSSLLVVDGKIIDKNKVDSLDDMLKSLEAENASNVPDLVVTDRLKLEKDPKKRSDQLSRLARLVTAGDFQARRVAAKLLGRGDDLGMVPYLIYALGDPDPLVPKYAEASLRVLSRRLSTRYLPDIEITEDRVYSPTEKKLAQEKWKEWYLSVRPDFVFLSDVN